MDLIDQLRKLKHLASIGDLLLLFEVFQELESGERKLSTIARGRGIKRQTLYKKIITAQEQLGSGAIFQKDAGRGTTLSDHDRELFNKIRDVLEAYRRLVAPLTDAESVLRIGATSVVASRILPEILNVFYALYPTVDVQVQIGKPFQLIDRRDEFHFVFVVAPPEYRGPWFEESKNGDLQLDLRLCLVCRYDHRFNNPDTRKLLRDEFSGKELDGEIVVKPSRPASMPNYPMDLLPRHPVRVIETKTYPQAHAHVRNDKAVAYSYREFIGQDKWLSMIDLPKSVTGKRKSATLCLIPTQSSGNTDYRDEFESVVRGWMQRRTARHKKARDLSKRIREFGMVYHVSTLDGKIKWIEGRIDFDITPGIHVSAPSDEVYQLKGLHRIASDSGREPVVAHVVGWLFVKQRDGQAARYHLMWNESPDICFGSVSFTFSDDQLDAPSNPLFGNWLGRSRWIDDDIMPMAGPIMLHSQSDLPASTLNNHVDEAQSSDSLDLYRNASGMEKWEG